VSDELDEQTAADAQRFMRRAVAFTLFCLAVSAVILLIDYSIKRDILARTREARQALDDLSAARQEAGSGQGAQAAGPEPGSGGDGNGAGDHGSDGVVDAAGQREDVAEAPPAPRGKVGSRTTRPASGTPGDG
jgi:hypothetical protein